MTASPFCTLWDCLMVHVQREGERRYWPHPSCNVTLCHHWWHIIVDTWLWGLFKCCECPRPWIYIRMWSSLYSAPPPFVRKLSLHLFFVFLSCFNQTHTQTLRPTQTRFHSIEIVCPAFLPDRTGKSRGAFVWTLDQSIDSASETLQLCFHPLLCMTLVSIVFYLYMHVLLLYPFAT